MVTSSTMSVVAQGSVLDNLNAVFAWPKDKIARELHPDFLRYFAEHIANGHVNNYHRQVASYMAESGIRGEILDFACGFALTSLCMRSLGADRVTGADIVQDKFVTARKLADLVGCDKVNFVRSDDNLLFPDKSFDGILVKDAISHLYEDSPFLRHAYRVLRPGGILLIVDDRNSLCVGTVWRTRQMWEWSEAGTPEQLRSLGLSRSYTEQRLDFLNEHFPDLDPGRRKEIAQTHRGYTNAQLECWLKGGKLGEPGAKCVGPGGGVQERLINPIKLKHQLQKMGFECRLRPRYRSETYKRVIVQSGWPLTLPLSGLFLLAARKT